MTTPGRQALVLFSGGQDSTTCLAWALDRYAHVETIGFDYQQRHIVELESRLAVRAGMETKLVIETPLMWLDKAQTWSLSAALGGETLNELIVEHTHSCYLGNRTHRHEWGYGCGQCPACALRARGYRAWRKH